MLKNPPQNIVNDYWAEKFKQAIFSESHWIKVWKQYRVPDTRPKWRQFLSRMKNRIHWYTIGKFRAWLHRDCGDY